MNARNIAGLAILLFACLPGCASTLAKNDKVEGTLKLGNVALANCMVQFIPDIDPTKQAPTSSGYTDEKGKFSLQFENKEPGAIIGKHNVVIVQGRAGVPGMDREEDQPRKGTIGPRIPAPYGLVTQTPLQVEVKAGQHIYDLVLVPNAMARSNDNK